MIGRIAYTEPALSSDEGLPLANGLLGALVWGDGQPLNISLDRTDLWDLRPVPEYQSPAYTYANVIAMHRAGKHDALSELLEKPYYRPGPTKIPVGRIELILGKGDFADAVLDPTSASATVRTASAAVHVRVDAAAMGGLIEAVGPEVMARVVVPPFGGKPDGWQAPPGFDASIGDVWELGYGPPTAYCEPGCEGFEQQCYGDFRFAVALVSTARDGRLRAAWSIATSDEAADPFTLARERAAALLDADPATALAAHRAWWDDYWASAMVRVPDPLIQHHYQLDMYKFGAAARRGAPPISLQGPWTGDNGRLPPWKGDYHHDLNTQMSYWPTYAGNQLEAGLGFLDWLWDTRTACREWTQRFYGVDGLNVPMTADLGNRQLGGWRQYTHSLATSAWLAQHFWLHWRYSLDRDYLATRAYPYVADVARFIVAISEERDGDGYRSIALSSSPEINDNRPEAWFDSITNYDLLCMVNALTIASQMAVLLDRMDEAQRWQAAAQEFPVSAVDGDGALLIAKNTPLAATHRHFSHLMSIFPFASIDPRRSDSEARCVAASLAQLDTLGTGLWMGYSFAWAACLQARAGNGERAAAALQAYADGFLLRNSFHANGDFASKGYSQAVFRAFTLEGNCAAAQAVHEMLLQSHNDVLHLFPAVPDAWQDMAFTLRAEGAVMVSAVVAAGRLQSVSLQSDVAQVVKVRCRDCAALVTVGLRCADPVVLDRAQLNLLEGEA